MGFTAVTIVAPNVPDGVDPLTYLTERSRDKAQEHAQQQALALGSARLNGSAGLSEALLNGGGSEDDNANALTSLARRQRTFTDEERLAAQESKKLTIPPRAAHPAKAASGQNLEYTYMYPQVKLRQPPHLLGSEPVMLWPGVDLSFGNAGAESTATGAGAGGAAGAARLNDSTAARQQNVPSELNNRTSSVTGNKPAPVVRPSMAEFMQPSSYEFIAKIVAEHPDAEIIKIVPPLGQYQPEPLPFGHDISGFKTNKQVFMTSEAASEFDMHVLRRGFFRAVIRFHATASVGTGKRRLSKLPTFERRPIDLYRLFRCVFERGGLAGVIKRKEWAQIGRELGYASQASPTISSTLRLAYVRVLQPFEEFLTANGVDLNAHTLPRLEVEDEARPAKPRDGVRVLPNGIIVEAPGAEVARDRVIAISEANRTQGPSFTAKAFAHKDSVHPLVPLSAPAEKKERVYWHLPPFFETEQLAADAGVRMLPLPASTAISPQAFIPFAGAGAAGSPVADPWHLGRLPFQPEAATKFVHEDIDDMVVPRLHIGRQFATQEWKVAPMAAYTLSRLVDGLPRTWYTRRTSSFTDQHHGDLVLVLPGAETMNWCHGFSIAETVNLLPTADWFPRAVNPEILDHEMQFCVQRTVYEALKVPLSAADRTHVVAALDKLRHREHRVFSALRHLPHGEVSPEFASRSITCVMTGAKRFFSWVLVNGEPWSPEAVLEQLQDAESAPSMRFVTRYASEPDAYFDKLLASLDAKTGPAERWRAATAALLANPSELPRASALQELIDTRPASLEDERIAQRLQQILDDMREWLAAAAPAQTTVQLAEKLRVQYNETVGCEDDRGEVAAVRYRMSNLTDRVQVVWNQCSAALRRGEMPGPELLAELQLLSGSFPEASQLVGLLQKTVEWSHAARDQVERRPVDCPALLALREQATALEFPLYTDVMQRLMEQLKWGLNNVEGFERLVHDRDAFDAVRIRFYMGAVTLNSFSPRQRRQLALLSSNIELLERMADPVLARRPQRREMVQLESFPAHEQAMLDLNAWLAAAQSQDWLLVIGQLQKMANLVPVVEPYGGPRISSSQLAQLRTRMYQLKVVPDDIVPVQKTIEDALAALNGSPRELRPLYGFDP